MKINTMTYNVYFSPAGKTKAVTDFVCEQFGNKRDVDLSLKAEELLLNEKDFCVVGVPSFGGRAPALACENLKRISGNKTPAFLIVTYGARAYEDTLIELKDTLENQGFICIGAAAMIAEHSIVTQIAAGRPLKEDYDELEGFLPVIKERLEGKMISIDVPGNRPYKKYGVSPINIKVSDSCIKCGICADKCPAEAISANNPKITDTEKCISCMRCVSICPVKARACDPERIAILTEKLIKACGQKKENEFF